MFTNQVLKVLENFGYIQRIIKVGGSYALILPKDWVEIFALATDEEEPKYWLKMVVQDSSIIFSSPDKEEITHFITTFFPTLQKPGQALAYSEAEIIEVCLEILKTRGIDLEDVLRYKKSPSHQY